MSILTLSMLVLIMMELGLASVSMDQSLSADPGSSMTLMASNPKPQGAETLVIYAYKEGETVQRQNLLFFLKTAVHQSPHIEFVFVGMDAPHCQDFKTLLPDLPNVHSVCRENKGMDLCAHHTILTDSRYFNMAKTKHVFMINSSGRGPFLPSHCQFVDSSMPQLKRTCETMPKVQEDWISRFTSALNGETKLVGAYINCEASPHVQSWMMAIEGSSVPLLNATLSCYDTYDDARFKGEVGMSQYLLSQGYNIGSMIQAYQQRDFRDTRNHGCNSQMNPGLGGKFCESSGLSVSASNTDSCRSLNPIDTVFVKNSGGLQRANVLDQGLMTEIDALTAKVLLSLSQKK